MLEIGEILHIFPSGTESMGDRGSKKAYTGPSTGIYLPTKFGCDRSIMVGCRSRNDIQTDRQTEWNDNKAHLCKRDAIKTLIFKDYIYAFPFHVKKWLFLALFSGYLFSFPIGQLLSKVFERGWNKFCLLYTSPSPRDRTRSRMPSSA